MFARPDVNAMAQDVVIVRQDQDTRPEWLQQRFGELGNYVPRMLFLNSDDNLQPQIQSEHPRYPYFYSQHVADRLMSNMHSATTGG